ncbi:biotin--[acetyl-CoA-carboxylase] ligase [Bacilliculturomica massiliensis]|uniref:biotin--[acetyl-CoA-carboxylase] ligase n=1 Tax=Bacilliculturomica massiliensis TaxID=1917867 RepID=UPI001030819C|nr:biotin--[acetyl-CoA-carboxylase] ligase [Bacilliculturomica massiliensis]
MTEKKAITMKDHVLRVLEQHRGQYISGAKIAEALSVTRASVWKAIGELRSDGYEIAAATNRGYSLAETSDLLSPQGIAAFLKCRDPLPEIHTYPVLESTNLTAKQMAVAGAPHLTVVAAASQTAGRGRMGRSFFSPEDAGVYFSVVLRPDAMAAAAQGFVNPVLITTAASVAAARAIQSLTGKDVQIKWVNDLYLDGKKICGILTEGVSDFETGSIESMVVGIGINCFTPQGGFPGDVADKAAALYSSVPENTDCGLGRFTKNRLIAAVIDELAAVQRELPDSRFIPEYRRRSLVLGREIRFYPGGMPSDMREDGRMDPEQPRKDMTQTGTTHKDSAPQHRSAGFAGRAVDIDDQGGLIVELPDHSLRTLSTGEISVRLADQTSAN